MSNSKKQVYFCQVALNLYYRMDALSPLPATIVDVMVDIRSISPDSGRSMWRPLTPEDVRLQP